MKLGLIGYGYWGGGFVARNIARVAELAVIADPDPFRMQEASAVWAAWGTRVVSEPRVALEECDAVWIATPAATHAALVHDALDAGCHVLCEKPFVLDADDAHVLADKAEAYDAALMVGHLSLYTGCHTSARFAMRDNKRTRIRSVRHTDRPSISDHDVLHGLGPHDLASVVDLLGEPDVAIASGGRHRVVAHLAWDAGHTADLVLDWCSDERHRRFWLNDVDYATADDQREPLLSQAERFLTIIEHPELRASKRAEAVAVAGLTARLSRHPVADPRETIPA